jgi:hypothetical protein
MLQILSGLNDVVARTLLVAYPAAPVGSPILLVLALRVLTVLTGTGLSVFK